MELRVLGKSPAWQDAGGACSGYLVVGEGTRLLLDCGSGVFGKLRAVVDYAEVDAVVISHLHADHILDLVPFASGLVYAPRHQPVPVDGHPGTDHPPRPRLLAPPGGRDAFRRLCAAGGMSEEHIESAFALEEYDPAAAGQGRRARGQLPAGPALPAHPGRLRRRRRLLRITYSADSSPSDALCDFARDTDLLLIEATLPRPEREGPRGHLTPEEAGEHGRRAGGAKARPDPHLGRAGRRLGPPRGRAQLRRAGRVAVEGAVYRV